MDDQELLRYSRQIMLPELDFDGQQRLSNARVLIIGLGGLGSPIAMYLAASGVGQLSLCDDDTVELSNLQRQIIHHTGDIGRSKVSSAKKRLLDINPGVNVRIINHRMDASELDSEVKQADVVVDGSDNFKSRFATNQACVNNLTPLVSGAAIRMEGQVSVFDARQDNSPCYRCLYTDEEELSLNCSDSGILAPVVGIIGSIQATETIKVITAIGEPLVGKLLLLDAKTMEFRTLRFKKDPQCPVCASR